MTSKFGPVPRSIVIIGLILVFTIILFPFAFNNDPKIRISIKQRETWINRNKNLVNGVFTEIFPKAQTCAQKGNIPLSFRDYKDYCNGEIRSLFDSKYSPLVSYSTGSGRQPMYFIRMKDNLSIEKLFQSGVYFTDYINTPGERAVAQILQGKREPFPYPLYTCCGTDDILPFHLPVTERNYLKDFYSEIELIFPIKDKSGKIIGGLVWLYGD